MISWSGKMAVSRGKWNGVACRTYPDPTFAMRHSISVDDTIRFLIFSTATFGAMWLVIPFPANTVWHTTTSTKWKNKVLLLEQYCKVILEPLDWNIAHLSLLL